MRKMRVEDQEVKNIRAQVRQEILFRQRLQQSPEHSQMSPYEQRCLEDDLRTLQGIAHNLTTLNGWRGGEEERVRENE